MYDFLEIEATEYNSDTDVVKMKKHKVDLSAFSGALQCGNRWIVTFRKHHHADNTYSYSKRYNISDAQYQVLDGYLKLREAYKHNLPTRNARYNEKRLAKLPVGYPFLT